MFKRLVLIVSYFFLSRVFISSIDRVMQLIYLPSLWRWLLQVLKNTTVTRYVEMIYIYELFLIVICLKVDMHWI